MYNHDADHILSMAKDINASMTWARTPQGSYYWSAVTKRLEAHAHYARSGITPVAGKVNIESRTSSGDGKFANLTDTPNRLMKVSTDLNSMCAWSLTPEGPDYWGDVSQSLIANAKAISHMAFHMPTTNQLERRKRLLAYAYQQAAESKNLVP